MQWLSSEVPNFSKIKSHNIRQESHRCDLLNSTKRQHGFSISAFRACLKNGRGPGISLIKETLEKGTMISGPEPSPVKRNVRALQAK
jgi:hypothetical protein